MTGTITVTLGGQTRTLNAKFGAWAAVEEHGYQWLALLPKLQAEPKDLSLRAVQEVLWAMLWKETPRPSLAEVGDWVDGTNFRPVLQAIIATIVADFAPPEEGEQRLGPPTPGAGTAPSTSPSA